MSTPTEVLVRYVPTLVLRRLATDPELRTEPVSETFDAAVLFADITGFTRLTERFAEYGKAGTEEITAIVNAYFECLVATVKAHGGDVLKFAGDAILAIFLAQDESDEPAPLHTATQRAAQCALMVQNDMGDYEAMPDIRLRLRIGIGAGAVTISHIGGVAGRWELLVTGRPLVQVSNAESLAEPRQVILSPEALACVQDNVKGQAKDAGYMELEGVRVLPMRALDAIAVDMQAESMLRAYIPPLILARIDANQAQWLAELRRVTVLFINLSDMIETIRLEQSQAMMQMLQTRLDHYQGTITRLGSDDKGTTVLAAFGLPHMAHEDDPARAVQSAIDIHQALIQLGLQSAIGITTGQAFCGEVGSKNRHEYTMMGDTVNLAARLMQAASKAPQGTAPSILCDEATYAEAVERLAFEALPKIAVKGKTEPIAVYQPTGKLTVAEVRIESLTEQVGSMVGRAKERQLLQEKLHTLKATALGGVFIISGEAGIGKSRLVSELVQQAEAIGLAHVIGTGDAIDKSTAYYAWRPIFQHLFAWESLPHEHEQQCQRIMDDIAKVAPDLVAFAPLLKAVLPLDIPENEITAYLAGDVRAEDTRALLVRLLQQIKVQNNTPLVLILEDAQWLDSASWQLALTVSQRLPAVLLIIVTRPMDDAQLTEYNRLATAPKTICIALEALSPEETVALVQHRLRVASLPEPVVRLLHEKAQGNPFFSEELADALRDSGLLMIEGETCHLSPSASDLSQLNFPDTIQSIVTSRIDRLSPQQQLVLKVASVIGRMFAYKALYDIHPVEADKTHLRDHLSTLEKLDFTPLESPDPDLAYIFKHIITQEVVYSLMLFAQQRHLHRAVATWYEYVYAQDLSRFYTVLAYHWQRVLETNQQDEEARTKAIDYLERAGEQALHRYANQEAIDILTHALKIAETYPISATRKGKWHRQIGAAYFSLGNTAQSRMHTEQALHLLQWPMPQTIEELDEAKRHERLQHSQSTLVPEQALEIVRSYEHLRDICYFAQELPQSSYAGQVAMTIAEWLGPSPELARCYAGMCLIPLPPEIVQDFKHRARQTAETVNQLPTTAWVLFLTAISDVNNGNWQAAKEALEQAADIQQRLGNQRRWEETQATLANVLIRSATSTEDLQRCIAYGEAIYASARQRGDTQQQIYDLLRKTEIALMQQDMLRKAVDLINQAITLLTEHSDPFEAIWAHGLQATAYWRTGQSDKVEPALEQAMQLITNTSPSISFNLEGYASVANISLELWQSSTHHSSKTKTYQLLAQQACQALHHHAQLFPISKPHALRAIGLYHWLEGQSVKAFELWQESLSVAENLNMPYQQALTHYELGRHLQKQDPARQTHITRAIILFTQVGATYDLERIWHLAQASRTQTIVYNKG